MQLSDTKFPRLNHDSCWIYVIQIIVIISKNNRSQSRHIVTGHSLNVHFTCNLAFGTSSWTKMTVA